MSAALAGITLAELLVSLLILAQIATFTIPKILQAQQASTFSAAAKQTVGMLSGAYQAYSAQGNTACTSAFNITNYMNFIAVDTSTTLGDAPGGGANKQCNSTRRCIKLHNGGMLYFWNQLTGDASNRAFAVTFDPDGRYTGNQDSIEFEIFANGRVKTWGTVITGDRYMRTDATCASQAWTPGNYDPSWFSW